MCNKFFDEIRVFLSANVFQLICHTANIFTPDAVDKKVDSDRHLAHLNRRRGAGCHDFFIVMEA
jgi:hypothetical protein